MHARNHVLIHWHTTNMLTPPYQVDPATLEPTNVPPQAAFWTQPQAQQDAAPALHDNREMAQGRSKLKGPEAEWNWGGGRQGLGAAGELAAGVPPGVAERRELKEGVEQGQNGAQSGEVEEGW